jgi:hypothetical protein
MVIPAAFIGSTVTSTTGDCYFINSNIELVATLTWSGNEVPGEYLDCNECTTFNPCPVTPSPSITPSISISKTPSVTPSRTPSISITPSISVSRTPSVTPSRTPSISISVTPSITPSISVSKTPSVTPSISISKTPSVTPSITPSVSGISYSFYANDWTPGTPCGPAYGIWLGSDGYYYATDDGAVTFTLLYSLAEFWYQYQYYDPFFDMYVYNQYSVDSTSTSINFEGQLSATCF